MRESLRGTPFLSGKRRHRPLLFHCETEYQPLARFTSFQTVSRSRTSYLMRATKTIGRPVSGSSPVPILPHFSGTILRPQPLQVHRRVRNDRSLSGIGIALSHIWIPLNPDGTRTARRLQDLDHSASPTADLDPNSRALWPIRRPHDLSSSLRAISRVM